MRTAAAGSLLHRVRRLHAGITNARLGISAAGSAQARHWEEKRLEIYSVALRNLLPVIQQQCVQDNGFARKVSTIGIRLLLEEDPIGAELIAHCAC